MTKLKEHDLQEGKKLAAIIAELPESEKKQAIIYVSALADRSMVHCDKAKKQCEEISTI